MRFFIAIFLVLLSFGVFPRAFAGGCLQRNPPGSTEGDASPPCGCQTGGDSVGADCIMVNLEMGATTPWTGSRPLALKVFADSDSPLVFTPDSLYPIMGYAFKRLGNAVMSDGVTAKEVVFSHPNGEPVHFVFKEGESLGRPDPGVHVPMDERLQMVDAQGWATARDPVYWDLYENDGTVRRFLATDVTGRRGALVSVTDSRGVVTTPADMGVDLVHGPDGVRQFLTPSRLADVRVVRDGYDVAVYPVSSVPAKDPATGLYALPDVPACRFLSVRSEDNGRRALVTLRSGGAEPRRYVFDYVAGDWSLTRPNGVRELKDRAVVDSAKARLSKEVRSPSNALLSKSVMNYRWESWGYAMTNKVEGFGDTTRTTSWTYFTSGNGKGKVRSSLSPTGLLTEYAYDAENRETSVRRSGPGMMTELVTYSYASVNPSDVVPPVDSRPRTVVKTLDGVECERTYYVYSPLTNVVERVGTQGAPYGGTNALRTVTAYYPVVAGDVRSGRVRSVRREDGRLDLYDYALVTNVWTETVTHLHEQSPDPVSGRTTRDVRVSNRRGETLEQKTEAFIDGTWHAIARNRMAYNLEGKRVRAEDLAGQVTATEWDCCHKVAETRPDGSRTTWDYDDEGNMTSSSRLIALDKTNVTWVTTFVEYDALGRKISSWVTNVTEHIGTSAVRFTYDCLGRPCTRVVPGKGVYRTMYSHDDLSITNIAPKGTVEVERRDAKGSVVSRIGNGLLSEYMLCGVRDDGIVWIKKIYGETSDAARYETKYENMLKQVILVEKSGFKKSVLATTYDYDGYGRAVLIASDGEPRVKQRYDNFGVVVETRYGVVSGDWRKEERCVAYELLAGEVWNVQRTVTRCSDPTITPLCQRIDVRMTGLENGIVAESRNVDARGNATVSWTVRRGDELIRCMRFPTSNLPKETRMRFGVILSSVSETGDVTHYFYDGLGRRIAERDGRGNVSSRTVDRYGRQVSSVDAAGNELRYGYDEFGQLISVTNASGEVVIYEYDLCGRKTFESGASNAVRYGYDIYGNRVSMTTYRNGIGSEGEETRWLYDDSSGAMTNKVYADGKCVSYLYDANGRMTRRVWARGVITNYSYDDWGMLVRTDYSDSTPSVVISYDAMGRQVCAVDAAGKTTYEYNDYGELMRESIDGLSGNDIILRHYDLYGRTTGYSFNGVRQTQLAYDDQSGRMMSMTVPGMSKPFVWEYLVGSDLKSSIEYPNGMRSTYVYGNRNELLRTKNELSSGLVSQYDFQYDNVGRRIVSVKSGKAYASPETYFYTYNDRSGITNVFSLAQNRSVAAYQYDGVGNRVSARDGLVDSGYAVNKVNQYTSINDFVPEYDDDGNMTLFVTTTGVWRVTYNAENRPIIWTSGDKTIVMQYDRMGRRISKDNVHYVYNGYLQIASRSVESEHVNTQLYVWDPTEVEQSRPLVWNDNGDVVFYVCDGNKNIVDVVSFGGEVVAHYDYSPFGGIVSKVGEVSDGNPWRFSSEYADDELGLVYYNFRHYNPIDGRWICRDPMPTDQMGVSPYDFCIGNPIMLVDRLGLECEAVEKSRHSVSILPLIGGEILADKLKGLKEKLKLKMLGAELSMDWDVNGTVSFVNKECSCCEQKGDVVDEEWKGEISGIVSISAYSSPRLPLPPIAGVEIDYWYGLMGSISGSVSGHVLGNSDRCNGVNLIVGLGVTFGASGELNFGGYFCVKLTSFLTYKISAYGGVSGGFVYTVNYQKEDDGPWHLVREGFDGSLAFHIHADFGFASYDYTKELL